MITLGLLMLATTPAGSPVVAASPMPPGAAPIVRLWLNSGRDFREGERARVQVEARDDGYLVVFNYDTEGRLRVLFPVTPRDDHFVQGGRRYEIEGRGDRESFLVGSEGDGLVFAAVAADPFDFRRYEAGGNWDYTRLYVDQESPDPEADLSDVLQEIVSDRGFDYDVIEYRVWGYRDYRLGSAWYPRPYGFYDDFYCDPWYRPSLFGCRYWWPGYRSYVGIGIYYPFGGYYPYRSGYGYGYGSPYGYGWWRRTVYRYPGVRNYNWPVVVGRPRGYTIVRRQPNRSVGARVPGSFGGGSIGGGRPGAIDSRPRLDGRSRPRRDDRPEARRPAANRPDAARQPSDRARPPARDGRPRARPVNPRPADDRPMVERDRGGARRGPVEVNERPRARPADPGGANRPAVVPDAPRRGEAERRPERGSSEPRARRVDVRSSRERPAASQPDIARPSERARTNDAPRRVDSPARSNDRGSRPASAVDRPRDDGGRARARPSPRRASPRAVDPPRSSSPRAGPVGSSPRAAPSRPSSRAVPSRPSPRAAPSRPSGPSRASAPRSAPPRASRPSSSSSGGRPRSRPNKP